VADRAAPGQTPSRLRLGGDVADPQATIVGDELHPDRARRFDVHPQIYHHESAAGAGPHASRVDRDRCRQDDEAGVVVVVEDGAGPFVGRVFDRE
jgi:hypothetical protein